MCCESNKILATRKKYDFFVFILCFKNSIRYLEVVQTKCTIKIKRQILKFVKRIFPANMYTLRLVPIVLKLLTTLYDTLWEQPALNVFVCIRNVRQSERVCFQLSKAEMF